MDALVEVLDVSPAQSGAERLSRFSIDGPVPGGEASSGANFALDVKGWVVGGEVPAVAIELLRDGSVLWQVPLHERPDVAATADIDAPELSGFYATVNTLRLGREFTITIQAVLADEARVEFATIRGRRAQLRTNFEPHLAPLMVTTLGRTGSTIVVGMLEQHPEVVTYPPFEDEPKVASYWFDVLLALSEPASYRRQLTPGRDLTSSWWLGEGMPMPRARWPRALHDWLGATAVETLAGFCQERIESLYEVIASQFEVRNPRYFAEKYWATSAVPDLVWELYDDAREVFVVRDFRDMLSSMYAFDAKRGYAAFGRQQAADDESHVIEQLQPRVESLRRQWQSRAEQAHLVRYEELVARPAEIVKGVLTYLELDATDVTVAAMTQTLTGSSAGMEAHRTTPDANSSIGRWRRDLDPALQRLCESAFGPALETFGYE
jgi:hypothetical protein